MPTCKYRITSPTIVLIFDGERHVAHTLPAAAIITTDTSAFDGNKLVKVTWDGQDTMMFAQDLLSRGEPVET